MAELELADGFVNVLHATFLAHVFRGEVGAGGRRLVAVLTKG